MDLQTILDEIGKNPSLIDGLLTPVLESVSGKKAIENRVEAGVKAKIDDEISKTYSRIDDDVFAIIGERPGQKDGNVKEKTYEFLKKKITDYKRLLDTEKTLSVDEKVKQLQSEVDKLKLEGGGKHVQEVFDQAKLQWESERETLKEQIRTKDESITSGRVKNDVSTALATIKFNPDVSDVIKNMVLSQAEAHLLANHKIEDNKVIYLNDEKKPLVNPTTFAPMSAAEVLSGFAPIKEISLKENAGGGGGADPDYKGQIQTAKVEGKDVRSLVLPNGSFKTRSEFIAVAEKALMSSGVTKRDPNWDTLKNKAYNDYEVDKLPAQ